MKKSVFVLTSLAVILCLATPVSAKWLFLGQNKKGEKFSVSDKTQPSRQAGCVLVQVLKKFPTPQNSKWGQFLYRKYIIRLCCRTKTQQQLGYVLYTATKQELKGVTARGRPFVCRGKGLCAGVQRKICPQ
ncbi:MAG: hypothetical protein KKC37_12115 [Proteobacteria bacterium]|nr:hypothetical protein [Pseudomonadota bacterium]